MSIQGRLSICWMAGQNTYFSSIFKMQKFVVVLISFIDPTV